MQPFTNDRCNIVKFLIESVRANRGLDCMRYLKRGEYVGIKWEEVLEIARRFSLGFQALGLELHGRVALMSKTRYEWRILDYAILSAGAVTVTVYPTLTSAQVEYIINDAECTMIVVDEARNLKKVLNIWQKCPKLKCAIYISKVPDEMKQANVYSLEDLIQKGTEFENHAKQPANEQAGAMIHDLLEIEKKIAKSYDKAKIAEWQLQAHELDAKIAEITKDPFFTRYLSFIDQDLCTIIYTSGTTGVPKGAMLTHYNMAHNAVQTASVVPLQQHDIALDFLPLSHSYERHTGQFCATLVGYTIAYARNTDSLIENMDQIRPTIFASVPLVWEKLYNRMIADILAEDNETVKKIFDHSCDWGWEYQTKLQNGEDISVGLALKNWLAHKLVFHKVKDILGGRVRLMFSGGAALNPLQGKFFFAAGFKIMEAYGLTETSPVLTLNRHTHIKIGTVGQAVPETKIKIAEDKEVLASGPQVFQGYWNKPDENATAFSEDAEGKWYHTGDLGEIDSEGFLKITGRKKTIIVLRTGKKISPVMPEAAILVDRHVRNICILGDDMKYLIAIIEPNWEYLGEWLGSKSLTTLKPKDFEVKNETTKEDYAIILESRKKILEKPEVTEFYQQILNETQKNLADFEKVRRFALVPEYWNEYTVLTPSLKLVRRKVVEFYKDLIGKTYVDKSE